MFVTPTTTDYATNVAQARQHLLAYGQIAPAAFAARRRQDLIAIVTHHYLSTANTAYHDLAAASGTTLGIKQSGPFGWLRRRSASAQLAIPANMPLEALLAMLPITDKQILIQGNYAEHPAVPREQIRFIPATSGTTTGIRAQLPLTLTSLWAPSMEPMIWYLLLFGLDPMTANGYAIAHFMRQQPEAQRSAATYAAFATYEQMAPERIHMGSTQDTLEQHIQQLTRPADWALASPTFYRNVALRASEDDLAQMPLNTIFWGAAPLSTEDAALLRTKFPTLQHSLGIYVTTEAGYVGIQLAEQMPYVVPTDRLIVEVVDEQGRHVAPGETGEVLVTSLVHAAAPIIRYKIGDKARFLGNPLTQTDLWRALQLPLAGAGEMSPLGQGLLRHGVFLDSLARSGGLIIGSAKIAYEDVARLQDEMAKRGTPAPMLQLAKRLDASGTQAVVVRVEAPAERADAYRATITEVIHVSRQLHYFFATGELPPPIIEIYAPGELSAGQFKVPPLVDETTQGATAPVFEKR